MTIYAQVSEGDGRQGPPSTNWTPWANCKSGDRAETIDRTINMVGRKFLRERGIRKGGPSCKFTVWTYTNEDPLHPNGLPMVAKATTMIAETNPRE